MPLLGDIGRARELAQSFAGFARAAGGVARAGLGVAVAGAAVVGGGIAGSLAAQAGQALDRAAALPENARTAVIQATAANFRLQRDPEGQAWAPRKKRYGNYRDYLPILYDIFGSLSFEVVLRVGGFSVKATSSKPYAFYHQTGTSRGLPRRAFLPSHPIPTSLSEQLQAAGSIVAKGLLSRIRNGAGS